MLAAAVLGLVIEYERERQDHAAGLRTHMILAVGAALAMPLSINVVIWSANLAPGGDPSRLASQVISGIGFLGAGVIFRYGSNVRGLTTAASLWTVAVIGLAVGAGLYMTGGVITVFLLFILTIMNYIEHRWIATYNRLHLSIWASERSDLLEDVKGILAQKKHKIGTIGIEKDLTNQQMVLDIYLRILDEDDYEGIIDQVAKIDGVQKVKISE